MKYMTSIAYTFDNFSDVAASKSLIEDIRKAMQTSDILITRLMSKFDSETRRLQ
jgi:hypothetical protein